MHHKTLDQRSPFNVQVYEKNGMKMLDYGYSEFVVVNEHPEPSGQIRYSCRKPNGRTTFSIVRFPDGAFSKMLRG